MAKYQGATQEKRGRVIKVEQLMEQGLTNQAQLAARLGVSVKSICLYQEEIYRSWRECPPSRTVEKRSLRVRQLEHVVQVANDCFLRSTEPAVQQTTKREEIPCTTCRGWGRVKLEPCTVCEGKGTVVEEVTTEKVAAGHGDPQFLAIAKDCIREIARLEGLYPSRRITKRVESRVLHAHLVQGRVEYAQASPDDLIAAKVALERLRGSSTPLIEQRVEDDGISAEEERPTARACEDRPGLPSGGS